MYTGSEAAAAGLQPGQCVLKVNGNNMIQSSFQDVLDHFSGRQPILEQQDTVRISTALFLTVLYVLYRLRWPAYGDPRVCFWHFIQYLFPFFETLFFFFFCHRAVVSGRTVCMRMWKSRCLSGVVRMAQIRRMVALMEQVKCVCLLTNDR